MQSVFQSRAFADAKRSASMLFASKSPLPTNLWAIKKVEFVNVDGKKVFRPVVTSRNRSIIDVLTAYVDSLPSRSIEHWIEMDYLGKYFHYRNWYVPMNLASCAGVEKWFWRGPDCPRSVRDYMDLFWEDFVPKNYAVVPFEKVKYRRYEASGGLSYWYNPVKGECEWTHSKKGPYWNRHVEGTKSWLEEAVRTLPTDILDFPVRSLLDIRLPELERLVIEIPGVRTESGPDKCRWFRISSSNQYIVGRSYVQPIQNNPVWKRSIHYMGIADNVRRGAIKSIYGGSDKPYFATNGDDFIIICPTCGRCHSGDWSNWDLHVSAELLLAAYESLYKAVLPFFNSDYQKKAFYVMAYEGIRAMTFWPWNEKGEESLSVRATLGHVRSGSGEFVMLNNCINQAVTQWLFERVHLQLGKSTKFPCKSRSFWPIFSNLALNVFGMVAKPSSQLTHPKGFIGSRCIHTLDDTFRPRPCVSSVVRNWVNPGFDPEEYPNNSALWQYARFLDLNKVMAYSEPAIGGRVMSTLLDVACDAGVEDPTGSHWSPVDLARAISAIAEEYSMASYLSGENGSGE